MHEYLLPILRKFARTHPGAWAEVWVGWYVVRLVVHADTVHSMSELTRLDAQTMTTSQWETLLLHLLRKSLLL